MDQKLAILTGRSAGATESFVVVPFELVKIKYAQLEPSLSELVIFIRILGCKTSRVHLLDPWMSSSKSLERMASSVSYSMQHKYGTTNIIFLGHRSLRRYGGDFLASPLVERRLLWLYLQSEVNAAEARGQYRIKQRYDYHCIMGRRNDLIFSSNERPTRYRRTRHDCSMTSPLVPSAAL